VALRFNYREVGLRKKHRAEFRPSCPVSQKDTRLQRKLKDASRVFISEFAGVECRPSNRLSPEYEAEAAIALHSSATEVTLIVSPLSSPVTTART
jgi:hypothetical protein